jgi:phosphatidylinositol alpha 1,6-mannosyltransferase
VRLFVDLERSLLAQGRRNFRFTLIGEGNERDWLRKNLEFGETPGILRGEALAEAFANMDVFVFPSRTDTFGLVLLEAMASGVPVVASPRLAPAWAYARCHGVSCAGSACRSRKASCN